MDDVAESMARLRTEDGITMPKPEEDARRAAAALLAVYPHAVPDGMDPATVDLRELADSTAITDLMADLLHLEALSGGDPYAAANGAVEDFESETV